MDRHEIVAAVRGYANEQLVTHFKPGSTYINPAAPWLNEDDVTTLAEVLLNFWYTEHKYCRKFEKELEKATGKAHVSLVNSGSSASLMAMLAAVIKTRSQKILDPEPKYVLTCTTGFPTTVSPIYQAGLIPIYVDMNWDLTPNMEQIKNELTGPRSPLIAGAIFAHTLGFPYDEVKVRDLLGPDRFLISDCCDAFGATIIGGIVTESGVEYVSQPVGAYSDLSTLSFFPSHHIMAIEGGAVMTNDGELHELVRSLSNWGRSCYCRPGEQNTCGHRFDWPERGDLPKGWDHKYIFDNLGYNLKMTEFQGALGYSQISRGADIVQARIDNYIWLYEQLNRVEYRDHFRLLPPTAGFSPFGFPILPRNSALVAPMIAYLEKNKVGTRRLFAGNLLRQPGFMYQPHVPPGYMDGSDYLMNHLFWISVSPSLTQDMKDYMVYVIDQFCVNHELVRP